jgi:EmrB/QacA subfamily drug resistance transporter
MNTPHKQHKGLLLGLLALAQFMVVLDTSIVNVALPAIQKALHFSSTNLQWVVTAYTLSVGGFLLLGGRAADLYGRKRTFIGGVIAFTIASLLVGLSQSSTSMIVLRGVQGLAAAFMSPAALSIVLNTFKEGAERNRALGVWAAVAAGGAAAGVLLGGVITEYLGWRWDFLVNVPVGIFVVIAAIRLVPHFDSEKDTSLDLPGAALVTSGLMLLVYTLTKASAWHWASGRTIGLLGLSAALLVSFIVNESRVKHPLVPLSIFRIRNVVGANLTQLPITASLFSMFFFLSLYLQTILDYSPVKSGLSFLPITIIIGITATIVSGAVTRFGYKPILVLAPLFMAVGLFMLGHVPVGGSYLHDVFPGLAIMAVGLGMSFVAMTIAATSGVPARESGLASGILNTSQQIGGALGLAVLSGVASTKTANVLASSPHTPLAAANALVQGFHSAFYTGVGFAITASVCALLLIRQHDSAERKLAAKSSVVSL